MPGEVLKRLRARILSGELPPGEALRQEAIAAELQVSRIPVREALRELAAEGLVRIEPHKGAVVTELSTNDINELFDLRELLEVDLFRRAIPRHTAATLTVAATILEAYEAALSEHAVPDWGVLNWRFHEALYRPADRPRSMTILQTVCGHTERYIRMQLSLSGEIDRAIAEHRALLALARASDAEAAGTALGHHIRGARDSLLSALVVPPTN